MHVSGGYLNPAITIMLWVFNRMASVKAAWLIGAQVLGAVLAAEWISTRDGVFGFDAVLADLGARV